MGGPLNLFLSSGEGPSSLSLTTSVVQRLLTVKWGSVSPDLPRDLPADAGRRSAEQGVVTFVVVHDLCPADGAPQLITAELDSDHEDHLALRAHALTTHGPVEAATQMQLTEQGLGGDRVSRDEHERLGWCGHDQHRDGHFFTHL